MPVSGIVISCQPDSTEAVSTVIQNLHHVEIHHRLENGKLVAVLDTAAVDDEIAIVNDILAVDGVLDVRLAYHNFEDLQDPLP